MASEQERQAILDSIWSPPGNWGKLPTGAWLWWFWLFFIHGEKTRESGKCRQLMILWSIKKDSEISCNGMPIITREQLVPKEGGKWLLDGAAAAWYFDGEKMREPFVLERSMMQLDSAGRRLDAPGTTPSSFSFDGKDYRVEISSGNARFCFTARQADAHPAVGPIHGRTALPAGMEIEGTRLESLALSGFEEEGGVRKPVSGTAYFQKILLACPPPQWFWGLFHFADGSFFTYMLPYAGRQALSDNLWKGARLRSPHFPLQQDILFYHAPSGRVFGGNRLSVEPARIGGELWSHQVKGGGKGFEISATASAYSHARWSFEKKIGALPAKSSFKYNEYPAVLERLELAASAGEKIKMENGWGNMENAWGFMI